MNNNNIIHSNNLDGLSLSDSNCTAPLLFRIPPSSAVSCLRCLDDVMIVGCQRDLRIYSLSHSKLLGQISRAHSAMVTCCDLSPQLLSSAGRDCSIKWFSWDRFQNIRVSASKHCHLDTITQIRFKPGSAANRLLSTSLDSTIKLWESETGRCLNTWNQSINSQLADPAQIGLILAFDFIAPDRHLYVTAGTSPDSLSNGKGRIAIWDGRTQTGVVQTLTQEDCGLMTAVNYQQQQEMIAAGGSDGIIRLYDNRKLQRQLICLTQITNKNPQYTHDSSASSQQQQQHHIKSLSIFHGKMIACQPNICTISVTSSHPPRQSDDFPYAYPIHSIFPNQIHPTAANFSACHYEPISSSLALATTEHIMVWRPKRSTLAG